MKYSLHTGRDVLILSLILCAACANLRQSNTTSLDWARDAVWYQIFPERFYNGDPSNDPVHPRDFTEELPGWRAHPWNSDFYMRQPWERNIWPENFYAMHMNRRYGGDLQGIIDKLDYLRELGITAIYLNPIFDANSHHKYDGNTYHHIDYFFGPDPSGDQALVSGAGETEDPATWVWTKADRLFITLLKEAHARGIHIVIDGVFNHVGRGHFAFKDVRMNQAQSRYADWFEIIRWDDPSTPEDEFDYHGWWGYKSLPELNEENGILVDGPRQYIQNSVHRWMDPDMDGDPSDGVDGWRLDVVQEMGDKWWRDWHTYIRSINPAIFTTAEIWDTQPRLLSDDFFTSSMNYPFAMAVLDFIMNKQLKIKPSQLDKRLAEVREAYGTNTSHVLQNLVASHDTDRLASMILNPDRHYDRDARPDRNAAGYKVHKPSDQEYHLQKLVAAFQMTYVGAPMIYYGDEVGMWGEDDPGCRKPMLWDEIKYEPETHHPTGLDRTADPVATNKELREYYRSIIRIRHEHPALRRGEYETIIIDDDHEIFGFRRWTDDESLVAVFNSSSLTQHLNLPGWQSWDTIFNLGTINDASADSMILDPHSFVLFGQ